MRLNLATLLLGFTLIGCWNFEALTDKSQPPVGDGGSGVDLYSCATTRSATRETCDDGVDNNDDCLVDCEDPQCADFIACLDKGKQFLGYGNKVGKNGTCGGGATPTDIKQTLLLSSDCSTGCACDSANTACNSMLHWYSDGGNNCNTEVSKSSFQSKSSGTDCKDIANPMGSYNYKLDTITSACPVDASKKGTLQNSWMTEDRICAQKTPCETLACIKSANIACIAFSGNFATCPSQFPVRASWFQNATDNRACNCQCAAGNNSCMVAAGDAQFADAVTCGGGKTAVTQAQVNTCIPSPVNGMGAKSFGFQPRPVCQSSGTAPTDLAAETAAGRVTLNSPITTCCTQ